MVKACLRANAKGAHGPDCWAPGELASMPHTAVVWLTAMFSALEAGDQWPRQLILARGVHLAKQQQATFSALKFRTLLITAAVCRCYGKIRMRHLQPWIESW
eukprot:3870567-Alexandrium_andersonii.AAC.1